MPSAQARRLGSALPTATALAVLLFGLCANVRSFVAGLSQADVTVASLECLASSELQHGGGASGAAFVECVRKGLGAATDEGLLREFLRNFSCAQDDAGTEPLRRVRVSVEAGYDSCEAAANAAAPPPQPGVDALEHPDLQYLPGVLPAGNDLGRERTMTAEQAAEHCLALDACEGWTFEGGAARGQAQVFFKSTAVGYRPHPGWHTYRRIRPPTCLADGAPGPREQREFDVDIIREEPLVAVVRGFADRAACEELVAAGGGWASMGRAYTSGGGHSSARRSYSSNMYPPLQSLRDPFTRLVGEMFSVTRNLTGYSVYPPGQEPVNAVLYKHEGDEYRPHCDGRCSGGMHEIGERVATSIVYCHVAEKGGQTSFSVDALKVQPADGDMLLFAYKYRNGRMTGLEAQHSGCPIRKGQKWIATQWYREGVSDDWNWEAAAHKLRSP